MLHSVYESLRETTPVAIVIISVAIMLFCGYLMTRLTRLAKLPNVTAYIVAGILIGPYVLDLIPAEVLSGTEFLPDIALAFIAFSTGQFFRISALKKNGIKVVYITLAESLSTRRPVSVPRNSMPSYMQVELTTVSDRSLPCSISANRLRTSFITP